MRRSVIALMALAMSVCRPDVAIGQRVGFASPPSAVTGRNGATVAFRANRPTDVEVAVLDPDGRVVRHLAAGLLGENAPPPLRRDSLDQQLRWDGRDDDGNVATGGPFTARIRLGLNARLDRVVGWSGQLIDQPRGVVCGPDGTLYVLFGGTLYAHRITTLIAAYDRDGKYVRQVFPGPANLPPDKRRGWPRVSLDGGEEVPAVFHLLTRCVYPGAVFGNRVLPAVTRDGRLIMLSGAKRGTIIKKPDLRDGRRLLILGCDGSVPENYLGPAVAGAELGGFGHVALSPDDRYAYVSGLFEEGTDGRGLCHVVFRVPLDGSEPAAVFIGTLYAAGSGTDGLNDPQGLATDADGNIYVADYGNSRIAVFGPAGRFRTEIPADYPDQVRVSRRTGAIYVMSVEERTKGITDQHYYVSAHNWKGARIVKFAGLDSPAQQASLAVPQEGKYGGGALLALDDSADPTLLWYAGTGYKRTDVLKIIDRGGSLEFVGDPIRALLEPDTAVPFVGDVAVVGEKLITRHPSFGWTQNASLLFNAISGAPEGTFVPKDETGKPVNYWTLVYGEMVAGLDRRLYVHADENLQRFAASSEAVPFRAVGSHMLPGLPHGHTRYAGLFVTPRGDIYIPTSSEHRGLTDMRIKHLGADGRAINDSLIRTQFARLGGLAVDRKGNVYLGAQVVPTGERIPEWFSGKLPEDTEYGHPGLAYTQAGAILKFPPAGGEIIADPQGEYSAYCQWKGSGTVSVRGAEWTRRLGLLPATHEIGCYCETTRFDIDPYDRLFVPDVFRFSVRVLDTEGNELTHFGAYGNMDSRGPDSPVPTPEIAFGWPLSVECANDRAYVADLVNRRVVAVRFEYAATAECPLPEGP
ncbi:MAG: hypothetical protein PVH68_00160 [Armatimonadota bacterium]|jgi:hypothetical protein